MTRKKSWFALISDQTEPPKSNNWGSSVEMTVQLSMSKHLTKWLWPHSIEVGRRVGPASDVGGEAYCHCSVGGFLDWEWRHSVQN